MFILLFSLLDDRYSIYSVINSMSIRIKELFEITLIMIKWMKESWILAVNVYEFLFP